MSGARNTAIGWFHTVSVAGAIIAEADSPGTPLARRPGGPPPPGPAPRSRTATGAAGGLSSPSPRGSPRSSPYGRGFGRLRREECATARRHQPSGSGHSIYSRPEEGGLDAIASQLASTICALALLARGMSFAGDPASGRAPRIAPVDPGCARSWRGVPGLGQRARVGAGDVRRPAALRGRLRRHPRQHAAAGASRAARIGRESIRRRHRGARGPRPTSAARPARGVTASNTSGGRPPTTRSPCSRPAPRRSSATSRWICRRATPTRADCWRPWRPRRSAARRRRHRGLRRRLGRSRQLGMQAVTVISISRSGEFSVATVTVVRAGLSVGKYFPYSSL